MVETRERGKQPYRETRRTPCTVGKTLKTRNLLNLHWLFCLRISAKSWTTFCRDRIAPNCTIRHPVRPIVALQRRMRFSARLAGFCRDRCHQRRARRAERASFSAFVSNLDFRVPRLRQIGWRAADWARAAAEKRPPERPRIEARVTAAYRASTFWSRCGPGLLDAYLSPGLDPGLRSGVSVFAVSNGNGAAAAAEAPEACGSCGDPRGPGSCSLN